MEVLLVNKVMCILLIIGVLFSFVSCDISKNEIVNQNYQTQSDKLNSVEENSVVITTGTVPIEDFEFRYGCWGDDMAEIKKREECEFLGETEDNLVFEGSLLGYDCSIVYQFDSNKLFGGGYIFDGIFTNAGQYIVAYNAMKEELNEKYGEPVTDEVVKMQNDNLIEAAGAANALEYGYVAYKTCWETENTEITMGMMSENYSVRIVLNYTDIDYEVNDDVVGF